MKNKKLIYFTDAFPAGTSVTWKLNELKHFVNYFKEITIVPYSFGKYTDKCEVPKGVRVTEPIFKNGPIKFSWFSVFKILFNINVIYFLSEFLKKKIYRNRQWFTPWLSTSLETIYMLKHPVIKEILFNADQETVFYFYWGKLSAFIAPFISKQKQSKVIVRMHRFDLYEFENNGYIPYRGPLLKNISLAAPSSQNGYDHIKSIYNNFKYNIEVVRTGVIGEGISKASTDGVLRIVSCSHILPVKRVELLASALKKIKIPTEWIHIGDGPLMAEVKKISDTFPDNVKISFAGLIDARKVLSFILSKPVDLFINVSTSEGVPFSIMEAFSASVPVMATNVGGTGEIVDDTTGRLLSADISADELAKEITKFYYLTAEEKNKLRTGAYQRYIKMCNADILADKLAKYMTGESGSPM